MTDSALDMREWFLCWDATNEAIIAARPFCYWPRMGSELERVMM